MTNIKILIHFIKNYIFNSLKKNQQQIKKRNNGLEV